MTLRALRPAGLLLLMILLALAASAPADWRLIEALRQGDAHFARGEYYAALQAYAQAAEFAPASQEVLLRTAQAHLARHEISQAVYLLGKLYPHARGERRQMVLEGLGQAAFLQGEWNDARRWWELALEAGESAIAYRGLAKLSEIEQKDVEAAQHWEALLALSPGDSEALCHLAWLSLARPDGPDREALSRAAAASSPCAEAAGELLRIFAASLSDAHAFAQAGILLFQHGEPGFALRMLERAVALEPAYAEAHAYRGAVLAELGRPASEAFQRALELDPDCLLAHYFLGRYHLRFGLGGPARQEFQTVLRLDPDNPAVYVDIALTYAVEGDYAGAEAALEQARRLAPNEPAVALAAARFYVERAYQLREKGIPTAREAVQLSGGSAEALDLLGWAYYLAGEPRQAVEVLSLAVERDPRHAGAWAHLGAARLAVGDHAGGTEALQRAVDLAPGTETARWARRMLGE